MGEATQSVLRGRRSGTYGQDDLNDGKDDVHGQVSDRSKHSHSNDDKDVPDELEDKVDVKLLAKSVKKGREGVERLWSATGKRVLQDVREDKAYADKGGQEALPCSDDSEPWEAESQKRKGPLQNVGDSTSTEGQEDRNEDQTHGNNLEGESEARGERDRESETIGRRATRSV